MFVAPALLPVLASFKRMLRQTTKYQIPTVFHQQSRWHGTSILLWRAKGSTTLSPTTLRITATADIVSSLPVASQMCFANGNDSRNLFKGRVRDENNCETSHQ